jgi:hypothetical protein
MFVGNISVKPSQDFIRPTRDALGFKMLVTYAKCNCVSHERRIIILFLCCFYFPFCIAKRLVVCKFGGMISAEYSIF